MRPGRPLAPADTGGAELSGERFLVTGCNGCIGAWVVKKLAERGATCVALDLVAAPERLHRILGGEPPEEVTVVRGDVVAGDVLPSLLEEHGITRIVHLAAMQIPFVAADPIRGAEVNVVGTLRVFEAARAGQVRNVVYASSAAVFGPASTRREPATLYGAYKVCNEDCARVYWADFRVPSLGLRPWAVFGPGRDQGLTAAPTHAMKAAVLGVPYRIPFGGRMNLQYASDVADTFVAAALADPPEAAVFNLAGAVVDVEELVAAIEDAWPAARGLVTHGGPPLPIEPELEDAGLRGLLGDVPRTELAVAVAETLEHFARLRDAGRLSPAELPAA